MRNMQTLKGSIGVFTLMFVASFLLLLPGCQGPMDPQADRTGTVSLTIGQLDMGRAIQPDIGLTDFTGFSAIFEHATFTDVPVVFATGTDSAEVELRTGDWDLTVYGYIDGTRVARYTRVVTVGEGGIVVNAVLAPIPGGSGRFEWDLTIPPDTSGRLEIRNVDSNGVITLSPLAVDAVDFAGGPDVSLWESYLVLDTNTYFVRFRLEHADYGVAILNSDLHVYQNMTSRIERTFTSDQFRAGIDEPEPAPLVGDSPTIDRTSRDLIVDGLTAANYQVHTGWQTTARTTTVDGVTVVYDIEGNQAGFRVLAPGASGVQPGDRIIVAGRTSHEFDNGGMDLASMAVLHADLARWSTGTAGAFEIGLLLDAALIAAGVGLVSNQWAPYDRPDNFTFSLEDVIVYRPAVLAEELPLSGWILTTGTYPRLPAWNASVMTGTALPGHNGLGVFHHGGGDWGGVQSATWVEHGGSLSLRVAARDVANLADFGLQIRAGLAVGDTLTVTGRVSAPAAPASTDRAMVIVNSGGFAPASNQMGFDHAVTDEPFTLTLPVVQVHTEGDGVEIRVHDNAGTVEAFYIDSITFHRPAAAGPEGQWQVVLASSYINPRQASLAATADGIVVSGRGTGEHDHNNGVLIDVIGLRTLAGNPTAPIVITGVAAEGNAMGTMATQGLDPNAHPTIAADGSFTLTIGTVAAAQAGGEAGWWNSPFPLIGSANNWASQVGGAQAVHNFTITGITVGGVSIYGLLTGTPPPTPPQFTMGNFITLNGIAAPGWAGNVITAGPKAGDAAGSPLYFGDSTGVASAAWVPHPSGTGFSLRVNAGPDRTGDNDNYAVQIRGLIQVGDRLQVTGRARFEEPGADGRSVRIVQSFGWNPQPDATPFGGHGAGGAGYASFTFDWIVPQVAENGLEIRVHQAAPNANNPHFIIDSITITRENGGNGTVERAITLGDGRSRESNDGNVVNRINNFDWEAWTDDRGPGTGSRMNIYTDGSFSSTWTETYNTLFRIGRRFPGQGSVISSLGTMSLRYAATNFWSSNGATYLTVYGWTRGREASGQTYAQIEWYIVDYWRNWINAGDNPPTTLVAGYVHHGTLNSNGYVYDIITGWRENQPAIEEDVPGTGNATFLQIFSVRRGSQLTGPGNGLSGTIDLSAHFERWNEIGLLTHDGTGTRAHWTSDALLYEISFTVEGFGGPPGSSGTGSVTALCITYGLNSVCTNPATCTHC